MVLFYLHLINTLALGAAATAYFRFPHLWEDQGVLFLTLVATATNCASMLAIGLWALLTQSTTSGKVALHAGFALALACAACYLAYRVGMDYHVISYFKIQLR
jgi:hypothetical protein